MLKQKPRIEQYHLHKDQPQQLQFAIYPLKAYLAGNIGHTTKAHVHSFYQVIWFTGGKGKHFVDFKSYEIAANTFFFIAKDQIHYFDHGDNYEGFTIHFNEPFLMDQESDTDLFLKQGIFNDFDSKPFFVIPQNSIANFHYLVAQLQKEMEVPQAFAHKDYLKNLLKLLLISLHRSGDKKKDQSLSVTQQSHVTFLKFRQELEANFRQIHTVNEYAGLLNISAKTLSNYTRAIKLKTPLAIINERITLEAKRLLAHSSLNINEIGFRLGYEDPSYFVKFFKKQTGKAPGDFRKAVS